MTVGYIPDDWVMPGWTAEDWKVDSARHDDIRAMGLAEYRRQEQEKRAEEDRVAAERSGRRREAQDRRREQARFELPFLDTSVAQIIMSTIATSLRYGENSLIIGAPGVGKTRALREIKRRAGAGDLDYDVALFDVAGAVGSSLREVYRLLGEALDVEHIDDIAAMRRRLVKKASRFPVILWDEAQNLGFRQLRDVLALSEEIPGLQMVFAGNGEVLKLVNSEQGAIAQISRRLPFREEIRCILDDDADMIADHFGVDGMDAIRLCREIGGRFHADGVAKVLMVASDRVGEGTPIRLPDIRDAPGVMPHIAHSLYRRQAPSPGAAADHPRPGLTARPCHA